jgi:pimeloyl-ACP methyl ester carboxylesterase
MARWRRRTSAAGIATGVAAAAVGAVIAAEKIAVGRIRLRPDPAADEPFGQVRGRPVEILADDGVVLHAEVSGPVDAPVTVVFCHGYCLSQDVWHYQRLALADECRLVLYDQRGHGRSGWGDSDRASIDQLGTDLAAVLAVTAPGDGPVVLVGHSMGGMTIMALADRHPELFENGPVAGVALINTSSGELGELTLGLPMAFAKVFKVAAPHVVNGLGRGANLVERGRRVGADLAFVVTRRIAFADKSVSPTVVAFLERMIQATPVDVIAEFYPTLIAHDKLAALDVLRRVPGLVLVGDADRLTPPAHGRAIAAALPDAELVEVPDGGHVVMLEHPVILTEALSRLIDRARPAAEEQTA